MLQSARTSEQIKAEIEERFGFFPHFFSPAIETPAVLENLWQQTLSPYVNNPLPALFKKKPLELLSRYCIVPYGMSARVSPCSVVLTIAPVRDAAGKLGGLALAVAGRHRAQACGGRARLN